MKAKHIRKRMLFAAVLCILFYCMFVISHDISKKQNAQMEKESIKETGLTLYYTNENFSGFINKAAEEYKKEKGITVVLITHYMDEAVLADRVIVMDSGKVLTEGTPYNVFSQVELLKKHRLDVPQATELVYRLIGCGAKIDKMPLDSDECVDLLMEVLK